MGFPLKQSIDYLSSEASLAQISQKELLARQRSLVSVQQTVERLATAGYRQSLVLGPGVYLESDWYCPIYTGIIFGWWDLWGYYGKLWDYENSLIIFDYYLLGIFDEIRLPNVGASESGEYANYDGEPVEFRKKHLSHGNYHMIFAVLKWVPNHLVIEFLYDWRNKHP